jgi:hypothetical protein
MPLRSSLSFTKTEEAKTQEQQNLFFSARDGKSSLAQCLCVYACVFLQLLTKPTRVTDEWPRVSESKDTHLFCLLHHPERAVHKHEHLDREAVLGERAELADGHERGTVAGNDDRWRPTGLERTDATWQRVAHASEASFLARSVRFQ